MEKGEPTLIPEWLKNTGNQNSGSSLSHLGANATAKLSRHKTFTYNNGHDLRRYSGSDRTTSSYFRQSSQIDGSGHLRSYNIFGRNQHNRELEKDMHYSRDREKLVLGNRHQMGISDSLRNSVSGKYDRDSIRQSQSSIYGKHSETWTKKIITDTSSSIGNNNNALLAKGIPAGGTNKAAFERNFPSLGAEERASAPDIGRIPSPGLGSAIQSLPVGPSITIGAEKWTSALAEVPVLVRSNEIGMSSVQQATSTVLGSVTCLNMAEAVAHSPNHAPNAPQLSLGTQRLEELAIKQSRQLIPVTPSMPKNLSLSSSDKQKIKAGQQQHPSSSLISNHTPGGSGKVDISRYSNVGKLQILNSVQEKSVAASTVKDNLISLTGSSVLGSTLPIAASVSGATAAKGPPNNPTSDRKPVSTVLEKRSNSQAQSRKEFFNLVRKKSMSNSFSVSDSTSENSTTVGIETALSESFSSKLDEKEINPASDAQTVVAQLAESGDHVAESADSSICVDGCDEQNCSHNGNQHASFDLKFPEEEEAAFLRSLGWEESADEDGLTEEEISCFLKDLAKYVNSKPAFKILGQGLQNKIVLLALALD